MTRHFTRRFQTLCIVAVLTILATLTSLAQVSQPSRPSEESSAVAAPTAISSAQAPQHPSLVGATNAYSVSSATGKKKKSRAAPQDGGNPLFLPAVPFNANGGGTESVTIADVNGDGKPDLIVANQGCVSCGDGSVSVLLGNGDGTFQPGVAYDSGGIFTNFVAVADVNGDGKPDLIAVNDYGECASGNCDGTVAVLLGNGDGTFQPAVEYDVPAENPDSVAVADLRGDGKLDLVVGIWNEGVAVLLGNGDGTFQPAVLTGGIGQVASVAIADVDHDGKLDLVLAGAGSLGGQVSILLGNGDGTFQSAVAYASGVSQGGWASSVAVADLNGDGKLDIVVTEYAESDVGVLLGNGDGTFKPATLFGTGASNAWSVAIADVNGDGNPDVLVANNCDPGGCTYGTAAVLLGNGDGTLQPPVVFGQPGGAFGIAVKDVNGDGRPDLAIANDNNTASIMLNNTGPHTATTTTLVSSLNPSLSEQTVTITATVGAASGSPAGTIIFYENSVQLSSQKLVSGSASISFSAGPGSYSFTAAYQGSLTFSPSTSAVLNQVVNYATTTTTLVSSVNPAKVKQSLTYTATIASQDGDATTGTVTFQDNGSTLATVTLSGTQAAYRTSYPMKGLHVITATYSGDANNSGSASPALTEQIGTEPYPSKTTLATSGSPSSVGQSVTFTATVTSIYGTIPDGEQVTFYNGVTEIGTGTTTSGVATITTSSLTAGSHHVMATYAGDAVFKLSSGSVRQVVDK